tara:strand:+ start:8545 stop:8769 length:225 start_codon:yes stop_codon:yes gene_type:complete
MYTLAIVFYSLGGAALAIAFFLMIMGAKPVKEDLSSCAGFISSQVGSFPYAVRLVCRYAYLVLLPLAALLHFFS